MKMRQQRRRLYAMAQAFKESHFWMTDEEFAWEFAPPVGREFGSLTYHKQPEVNLRAPCLRFDESCEPVGMDGIGCGCR